MIHKIVWATEPGPGQAIAEQVKYPNGYELFCWSQSSWEKIIKFEDVDRICIWKPKGSNIQTIPNK